MQVQETAAEGLKREYKVTVAAADMQKINARLQKAGQSVKMPGFRPGKVPANLLKQRYGQQVTAEVVDEQLQKQTDQLLTDKKLRVATQPKVALLAFDEGKDLEFSVALEIFPDMPEVDFGTLTLEKMTFDVDDKEVTDGLNRLAERMAQPEKVEEVRPAKKGDVAVIDFLGKLSGVPFDGGKGENFNLELGSGQFIPGFEEQLIGLKAGESKVITVTFPADYHSEELKGKESTFDVTIHELRERKTPKVDEDFAKKLEFDSLDGLKEKIKEQIVRDFDSIVRLRLKKLLFDQLDGKLSFDLPPSMVDQEFAGIWQKIEQAKAQGDEELDKPEEELRKEYRTVAERRVKLGLFLADISGKNSLSVSQDELRQAVLTQARMFPGQENVIFDFYRKNPRMLTELQGPLLEEKAVDYVLAKVQYNEKKMTLEDLRKIDESGEMADESAAKTDKKAEKAKPAKAKKTDDKKADDKKEGDLFA
jgi:trigger factor